MDCSEFSCAGKPPKNATFEKHQTPNTKHQKNPKHQIPKFLGRASFCRLEFWSFSGVWSLVFGVSNVVFGRWCFGFGISFAQPHLSTHASSSNLSCLSPGAGSVVRRAGDIAVARG